MLVYLVIWWISSAHTTVQIQGNVKMGQRKEALPQTLRLRQLSSRRNKKVNLWDQDRKTMELWKNFKKACLYSNVDQGWSRLPMLQVVKCSEGKIKKKTCWKFMSHTWLTYSLLRWPSQTQLTGAEREKERGKVNTKQKFAWTEVFS